jgi:hypothetical protein
MDNATMAALLGRWTGRAWRGLVWIQDQIDWAEVGQIVWHGLIALVVLTWMAGLELGRWVHRVNDGCARVWVRLWVGEATGKQGLQVEPLPLLLLPPAAAPVALLAPARAPVAPVMPLDAVVVLAAGGMSQRAIAKSLGLSRHRVRAALAA